MRLTQYPTAAALSAVVGICAAAASTQLQADKLALDPGMTGVPDMGVISCEILTNMHLRGPKGTRRAALYWTGGYIYAKSGKVLDDVIAAAEAPASGGSWDWQTTTSFLVDYCREKPEAPLAEAADSLWTTLSGSGT